jgi:Molybdopterin-binding domain of aldehyde dehydrogenase
MNPRTAHSQLMGGMIFGLGKRLMEETVFDPITGLPVVRNLADYHVSSSADTPTSRSRCSALIKANLTIAEDLSDGAEGAANEGQIAKLI